MKRLLVSAIIIATILACSLLPGRIYANLLTSGGYPIPGAPIWVAMSAQRWDAFIDKSPITGSPTLIITVYKP